MWLTSIDTGVLREDLATRIVRIELEPLNPERRLPDGQLTRRQKEAQPVVTAALRDPLVDVLSLLPQESAEGLTHRMGDFEQVLRCVDHVLGTSGATSWRPCRPSSPRTSSTSTLSLPRCWPACANRQAGRVFRR